jgi:nucleoside 2-deoxyribosyltransferase
MSAERRRRSYFAAPLFNEMERRYNLDIVSELEKSVEVFLPQRDGGLLVKLVNEGLAVQAAEQRIFEDDLAAIEHSDFVIAILDGGHIDEGVAFEIGYAFALGKPCVGFQTDARRALPTGNNPMIGRSLSLICQTRQHLVDWVQNFASSEPANYNSSLPYSAADASMHG